MTDRLRYIKPAVPADPALVAAALRKIATALDAGDDKREIVFYSPISSSNDLVSYMMAWSQAALIIADMADVDSVTLRAMAVTIDKGEQHALPF